MGTGPIKVIEYATVDKKTNLSNWKFKLTLTNAAYRRRVDKSIMKLNLNELETV